MFVLIEGSQSQTEKKKMNEFQERFKNFGNRKLLEIVEDAESYQLTAVEAAKLELSKRNISDEEIQAVKYAFQEKQAKIDKRKRQIKKVEKRAKAIGIEILETVSPIQRESQTIDRKINLIVIVFGLFAVYQIFKKFSMIRFMFTDSYAKWDFSMVLYFLPMILLPIAVSLFWQRNKIGWILMSAFFVNNIVNAIGMFFLTWEWNTEDKYLNNSSSGDFQIEFREIGNIFPQPDPIVYLMVIVIFGVTLWGICKEDLRNEFQVDVKNSLIIIGVSTLVTIMGLV